MLNSIQMPFDYTQNWKHNLTIINQNQILAGFWFNSYYHQLKHSRPHFNFFASETKLQNFNQTHIELLYNNEMEIDLSQNKILCVVYVVQAIYSRSNKIIQNNSTRWLCKTKHENKRKKSIESLLSQWIWENLGKNLLFVSKDWNYDIRSSNSNTCWQVDA